MPACLPRRLHLLACLAPLLGACAGSAAISTGYGPPSNQPTHPLPVQAPLETRRLVPRAFPAATMREAGKTLQTRRTRLDPADAQLQNYEVQIVLVHDDPASAEADALLAGWMTGRSLPDGSTLTELAVAHSDDGGRAFTPVPITFPDGPALIDFDPTVAYDADVGRAWVSLMRQSAVAPFERTLWLATSLGEDAAAFAPARRIEQPPEAPIDKGWLASGVLPGGEHTLYLTDRVGVRISLDAGDTWSAAAALPDQSNLLQPLVLADGDLGVSYLGRQMQALFVRSDGLGAIGTPVAIHTFAGTLAELATAALPGSFRAPPTAQFAASGDGTRLYAVLSDITRREGSDADLDVLLYTSTDGGLTWDAGRNLSAGLPAWSDQFLPWIAVDARERLHLTWLDTREHDGSDTAASTPVDVWYARSDDRGASWTSHRLTPQSIPSQQTRWSPIGNTADAQFLGDYITAVASTHAAYVAHPVYEDGVVGMAVTRIANETAGSGEIRDPRGLSGLWYDPASSGQGFEFNWIVGETLAVAFYGHRNDGENFFLVGLHPGRPRYGQPMEIPLRLTRGGRFTDFDPATITSTPWGTLRLTLTACGAADARLTGLDGSQTLALRRLALAPDLPCD